MAVTSYATLQAAIASWANRDDVTAVIPDWIAFFEERARRELREWLTTTVSLTNVTGDTALAATVEAVLSVAYNDGAGGVRNHPLELLSFQDYHAKMEQNSAVRSPSRGVYVDRDESANTTTLRFYPPCSVASPIANLAVLVIGYLPSLSDAAPTNRLLVSAPSLYLKGALIEGAEWLEHDERIPVWEKEVSRGIRGLQVQTERQRSGGAPRPMQLARVFGERP